MRSVSESMSTDGSGPWTKESRAVKVTGLKLGYVEEDGSYVELNVYFDTTSWDVSKHGLIYEDEGFLAELRDYLKRAGYAGQVSYSEQGLQGDNYVSLDADKEFLDSWNSK